MLRLRILTLCSVALATVVFFYKKKDATIPMGNGLIVDKAWLQANKHPLTPAKDIRPADQTFLTFPEWYLVFSPEDQANYYKNTTATTFPYMVHTMQIWQSYHIVNDQIKENFPVNKGYHFMIWVIGTSASAEYTIKSWYETVIGRFTDTHEAITDEDKFNAQFTQDYVDFIKDHPWYEFDFKSRLRSLWVDNSFFGAHFLRKLERKYILTSELLVKTGYGKLIQAGTKTIYNEALPTTLVVVDSVPPANKGALSFTMLKDGSGMIALPRYDKFNKAISNLAKAGFTFKEIAGNNSAILLTVFTDDDVVESFPCAKTLFVQCVIADPYHVKRTALVVPVKDLNNLLLYLDNHKIRIEHVFDY